jgi:hypothetical protein
VKLLALCSEQRALRGQDRAGSEATTRRASIRLVWFGYTPREGGLKECGEQPVFLLVLNYQKMSLLLLLAGTMSMGCGSEEDRPPPAPADLELTDLSRYDSSTADARDVWAEGACESGTTQECRVYLPAHDGIQPCFVGRQQCRNEQWGLCEEAELVNANPSDTTVAPYAAP